MVAPPPGPLGFAVHMVATAVRQPNGLDLCGPVVDILVEQLRSIDEEGSRVLTLVSLVEAIGSLIVADALTVFVPPIYPPVVDPITLTGAATTVGMPTAPPPSSLPEAVTLPSTALRAPTPAPTIPSATPSDHVAGLGSSGSTVSTPAVPIAAPPEADLIASPARPSPGPVLSTIPDSRVDDPPRSTTPLFLPEQSPSSPGIPLVKRVSSSKGATSPVEAAISLSSPIRSTVLSTKTDLIRWPCDFTPLASEDETSGMLSMDPPPPRPSRPLPTRPGPSACKSTGRKSRTSPDIAITLMGWLAYPKDEVPKGLKSLVRPDSFLSKSEWKFILCLAKWGVSYSELIPVVESARCLKCGPSEADLPCHRHPALPGRLACFECGSRHQSCVVPQPIFLGTAFDQLFDVEGWIRDYQQRIAAHPKVFKKPSNDSDARPAVAHQTPIGNPSVTVPRKRTTVSIVPETRPSVRAVRLKLADPVEKTPRPVVTTKPEAGPSSTRVVPLDESADTLRKDPRGFVLGLIECERRLGQLFDFLLSDSRQHLASLEVLASLLAPAMDNIDDSQSSDSDKVDELTESPPPYVGKGKGRA
ncbi:hypothetical protein NEOLEDRAFT_1149921 [Neolentinus lepideus HHB14362 ss-1]|uniref:Uncharacterized protein n=1 Tax=Neolentinus lepideus HHB14362 ss-1 TaxID=1314782 RepID=A0A165QK58_9AGAM|nr:hypothetical protein NEOLEDRAFT_1149921 [Neolentinus lepideus HHB14362 ss-1]